jgi:hypothetical protein
MDRKIGWWPHRDKARKVLALGAAAALLATAGVAVQTTAMPERAEAASTWWAKNTQCYNGKLRHTWYRVIDYNWYEELSGKIDYNYPNLYYPDHYEYTNIGCIRV